MIHNKFVCLRGRERKINKRQIFIQIKIEKIFTTSHKQIKHFHKLTNQNILKKKIEAELTRSRLKWCFVKTRPRYRREIKSAFNFRSKKAMRTTHSKMSMLTITRTYEKNQSCENCL